MPCCPHPILSWLWGNWGSGPAPQSHRSELRLLLTCSELEAVGAGEASCHVMNHWPVPSAGDRLKQRPLSLVRWALQVPWPSQKKREGEGQRPASDLLS
jgi:hypothetical protein